MAAFMHGREEKHHRNPLTEDSTRPDPSIAGQIKAKTGGDDGKMTGKMSQPPDIGSRRQLPLFGR